MLTLVVFVLVYKSSKYWCSAATDTLMLDLMAAVATAILQHTILLPQNILFYSIFIPHSIFFTNFLLERILHSLI